MILAGWGLVALLMAAFWVVQLRTRNAGWVDVGWALGTGGLGVLHVVIGDGALLPRVIAGAMAGLWGTRLVWLLVPRLLHREEEPRYARLRDHWGPDADRNLFGFFQGQAALAVILSLPFFFAAGRKDPGLGPLALIALGLWAIGWIGETIADRQLTRFKNDPANHGRVCDVGLWRYSRHPNYFSEWIVWCGHGLFGFGTGWDALSLLAPAIMLVLLVGVTGIPPAERQSLARRGDAYRKYMEKTSPFIPWAPRAAKLEQPVSGSA